MPHLLTTVVVVVVDMSNLEDRIAARRKHYKKVRLEDSSHPYIIITNRLLVGVLLAPGTIHCLCRLVILTTLDVEERMRLCRLGRLRRRSS